MMALRHSPMKKRKMMQQVGIQPIVSESRQCIVVRFKQLSLTRYI